MVVKSTIFSQDVMNSAGRIYFLAPRGAFFEVLCFTIEHESLVSAVRKAYDFILSRYGFFPPVVFVPLYDYTEHTRNTDIALGDISISEVCDELDMRMVVMTPRELRSMIAPTIDINEQI